MKRVKEGISLVALVITIIVLIILTGTVIATFMEGGIIDRAKEAVSKSDYTTLREAYDVKYSEEKINIETGLGGEVDKQKVLKKAVEAVGMQKDFCEVEYNDKKEYIYEGENKDIQIWLSELGILCCKREDAELIMELIENGDVLYSQGYLTGNIDSIINTINNNEKYSIKNNGVEKRISGLTTGDKIVDSSEREVATIIKYGDSNGDCYNDFGDASIILGFLVKAKVNYKLTEAQIIAMDVNNDGYITYADSYFNLEIISEIEQKVPANANKKIIYSEDIISGIASLNIVNSFKEEEKGSRKYLILSLNQNITSEDIKKMFLPYMKEIVILDIGGYRIEGTEVMNVETGTNISINNAFSFKVIYE